MFKAALVKEFTLVFRDLHSVLVLFAMPVVFIVIMSLAMQEQLSGDSDIRINVKYSDSGKSKASSRLLEELKKNHFFNIEEEIIADPLNYFATEKNRVSDLQAIITLSKNFDLYTKEPKLDEPLMQIWLAPSVDVRTKIIISSAIKAAFSSVLLSQLFPEDDFARSRVLSQLTQGKYLVSKYAFTLMDKRGDSVAKAPTSVQQSVPAWLIFSMFFVVIPISTTLVTERQQGTLLRLQSMNFPLYLFLWAKLVPYLLINQLQLVLMLLVGRYLIPALGGDYLMIGDEYAALALMSLAVGFSAVGYALLIAVLVKTTEQATSVGGVGNILLGAIGGVMVPKFIMPEYLQDFTNISPMAWGLEGFLDIFLRGKGVHGVLIEAGGLFVFGFVLLGVAFALFHRQTFR